MKKHIRQRKLALQPETLRTLAAVQLAGVCGGEVTPTRDEANGCPLVAVTGTLCAQ